MMNSMNPHQQGYQGLSPERLQLFAAGLSGMNPDEIRKAKLLFIKNEISEFKASLATFSSFSKAQGCFGLIPIFWPILKAQRTTIKAAITMQLEQIQNAIDVWRDDLGADATELEASLRAIKPPGH